MYSLADKLLYSLSAKDGIQRAIIGHNVACPDTTPFAEYGNLITSIQGGSGDIPAISRNVITSRPLCPKPIVPIYTTYEVFTVAPVSVRIEVKQ